MLYFSRTIFFIEGLTKLSKICYFFIIQNTLINGGGDQTLNNLRSKLLRYFSIDGHFTTIYVLQRYIFGLILQRYAYNFYLSSQRFGYSTLGTLGMDSTHFASGASRQQSIEKHVLKSKDAAIFFINKKLKHTCAVSI